MAVDRREVNGLETFTQKADLMGLADCVEPRRYMVGG